MVIPLNNTIPDIATMSKRLKTNDFCESLLLFATNMQTLLYIINKHTFHFLITELYTELEKTATDSMIDTFGKIWPKAPNSLSRRLDEVKTNLRVKGITIEGYLADTSTCITN